MTSLATRPPGGRTALAIAAFGALYVWILCMCYGRLLANPNQYDDAYITYRYAVNLAERSELTFNSYERVNSASSLLYTLALAGFYKCGLHDLETVGLAFGVVSVSPFFWPDALPIGCGWPRRSFSRWQFRARCPAGR